MKSFRRICPIGQGGGLHDLRGISDEGYDYMIHWMQQEGFDALIDHLRAKCKNVSEFVQLIENKEDLAESELMPCTWNNGMVE